MVDVSRQAHYMNQRVQPIRYMQQSMAPEAFKGFLKGNIIKYLMREEKKNKLEDVQKAMVYMTWLLEFTQTGDIYVPGEEE